MCIVKDKKTLKNNHSELILETVVSTDLNSSFMIHSSPTSIIGVRGINHGALQKTTFRRLLGGK